MQAHQLARPFPVTRLDADAHSPVVAVVAADGGRRAPLIGAITVSDLLGRLLPACVPTQDG